MNEIRADLHSHSIRSDGTDTPAEVVAHAAAAGLDLIALTDHDTSEGWAQARTAGERLGVQVLTGIEISTTRDHASLHVLGYLLDPTAELIAAEMERSRVSRTTRAQRMVDLLAQDYPITWQDVVEHVGPGATIGRPHIADALVAAGSFAHRDDAFASVLHHRSPYHVTHYAPDVAVAVRAIGEAGGVAVLAHGRASRQRLLASDELVEELVEAGLHGLEVDHRDHPAREREVLRGWCSRWDLIVTGGSDYHGTGKRNRLAENLTGADQVERLLATAR